jgi:ABC-type transporter Mla subunit MlaD
MAVGLAGIAALGVVVLGAHYLDVSPAGTHRQPPGTEIPGARTAPAYEVVPALRALSGRIQRIDTARLASAFDTVSRTLRAAVRSLLSGTVSLSEQVTAAIEENRATLGPALARLHQVIGPLNRNQGNLEDALRGLASFVTTSGDAAGSGRWTDGYLQNLVPVPVSVAKGTR